MFPWMSLRIRKRIGRGDLKAKGYQTVAVTLVCERLVAVIGTRWGRFNAISN